MSRKIEKRIEIAAPPETVWKALTDAEELKRWFPLDARVEPGPGGSIWISWGPRFEGASRIEIWEPGRRLRTVMAPPEGAETTFFGQSEATAGREGAVMALEYLLEGRGGRTVLRLVHSGFGSGGEWEEEYESVRHGWEFELRSLRHYLERHHGRTRHVAWVRLPTRMSRQQAWDRFMGADGFARGGMPASLDRGERYSAVTTAGDPLKGVVEIWDPPVQFAATVDNLGDALLRLEQDGSTGAMEASLWLAAWELPETEVAAIRERWTPLMKGLFPQA